jgi:hypothetical protein
MTRFTSIALAITTLSIAACQAQSDQDALSAELAVDSTDVSQSESALLASAVDGAEVAPAGLVAAAGPTPQGVADFIAQHAPQRYQPAGCVTVTQAGLTVKLVFAQCTGPRGLRQLSGELDLTASAGAGGAIDVAAHAVDLEVGQATMTIDSAAVYTVAGATKSLAVTSHGTGTGALGNAITHDGAYTTTWDASCVSIDGSWSTEVGEAGRSTTASVMRCMNECPTGTITRDTFRGRTISITFDGTATATWSTSAGRSGTVALPCGK